jgi:hypothetical protein
VSSKFCVINKRGREYVKRKIRKNQKLVSLAWKAKVIPIYDTRNLF